MRLMLWNTLGKKRFDAKVLVMLNLKPEMKSLFERNYESDSLTIVSFTGSSRVENSSSAPWEAIGTVISPSTGISSDIETSDRPANCGKAN